MLLMKLCFSFLQGGRPGYLAIFLRKIRKLWFWMIFLLIANEIVFGIFAGGRPGYLTDVPRKVKKQIQSELGTWISQGF